MRVRQVFATIVAAVALAAVFAPQAHAYPTDYTGAEEICAGGCGTAGGVLLRNGRYYMMTVAHITTLGSDVYAYHPTFRYVGRVAYKSTEKDIALIDMGTVAQNPHLRVADAPTFTTPPGFVVPSIATIWGVPAGPDWPGHQSICTTGWSSSGQGIKTKCGYADNFLGDCATYWCGIRAYPGQGYIAASSDAGSSGSVVWKPENDGRVRLLGYLSNCVSSIPCTSALFRPVFLFTTHPWTASETLPGYPTGAGGVVQTWD